MLPKIEKWQKRSLNETYPIIFIDAIHFTVHESGVKKELTAYAVLGVNESSKSWLSVMNGLQNRAVKDIFVICTDGFTGIKEAI